MTPHVHNPGAAPDVIPIPLSSSLCSMTPNAPLLGVDRGTNFKVISRLLPSSLLIIQASSSAPLGKAGTQKPRLGLAHGFSTTRVSPRPTMGKTPQQHPPCWSRFVPSTFETGCSGPQGSKPSGSEVDCTTNTITHEIETDPPAGDPKARCTRKLVRSGYLHLWHTDDVETPPKANPS